MLNYFKYQLKEFPNSAEPLDPLGRRPWWGQPGRGLLVYNPTGENLVELGELIHKQTVN